MQFEPNHIYHIYNRGNNSQKVFFNRENYLFFLQKIKKYITPFADILAWCLMPNHFHIMVYVNVVEIDIFNSEGFTQSETLTGNPIETLTKEKKQRTFNDSIGIILISYSRAIQKQQKITGSIFQKTTKANCLTDISGITPAWFQSQYGTIINIIDPEKEYPQVCFNYIHKPVKCRVS
jgi:putative transposase